MKEHQLQPYIAAETASAPAGGGHDSGRSSSVNGTLRPAGMPTGDQK